MSAQYPKVASWASALDAEALATRAIRKEKNIATLVTEILAAAAKKGNA